MFRSPAKYLRELRTRVSGVRLRAAIGMPQLIVGPPSIPSAPVSPSDRETVFVTDTPTDLSVSDSFGHKAYAEAIAGILAEAKAPFTLGLFGDWGFGKTSIINEVGRRMVRNENCAFASFDVWRYQGDALRRQFLRDVAEQLHEQGFLRRRYKPKKALRDLEVDVAASEQQFRVSWRGLVIALMQGAIVGFVVWLFLQSRYPN